MKKILMSHGMDKRELYNVLNASPARLADHVGETFEISAYAITETTNDVTGETSKGFTFKDTDGNYYGTGGKAFVEGIESFVGIMGEDELTRLTVGTKVSRSGREYLIFLA